MFCKTYKKLKILKTYTEATCEEIENKKLKCMLSSMKATRMWALSLKEKSKNKIIFEFVFVKKVFKDVLKIYQLFN